ncbi:rhodanese-like domain-containing protein [Gemella sp. GH3]|uniref:rhodanese-like domain-containing protein n=1 Tax=unclassified Gemella TaxID=2624949 RepID=UPI0015D07BF3|nr:MULTISPECIES: rhodanese-like domain-containing protein [unclassified Gemella]MBF0713664.1 rhodanese-like domain-containing protein [Gemella sp. GH3.1]NYS50616.1 rhodanese-like domain-containing protein [Gemella sp. GH3]
MKFRKIMTLLFLSTIAINLSACSTDDKHNHNSDVSNKSSEIKFKEIVGEELQKIQDTNFDTENYILVDTRSNEDYKKGHLKYALNIPFKEFKNNVSKLEQYKDKKIIFYCHKKTMSIDAAKMLVDAGFDKENLVIAPGVKEYTDYKFEKYVNVIGEDFQQMLANEDGLVLDVRTQADYNKGHIKNSQNIDVDNLDNIVSVLPSDKNTYIYVYSYNKNTATVVSQRLVELGYFNVINSLSGTDYYNFEF